MQRDVMKSFITAAGLLPDKLRRECLSAPEEDRLQAEEIRLRIGRPMTVRGGGRTLFQGSVVTERDMEECLLASAGSSVHSCQESLAYGFVTSPAGHRVGICGGSDTADRLCSVNVRIAKDIKGASGKLAELFPDCGGLLIISPPGAGKTTALRDLARKLSENANIAVCDERMEVFPVHRGTPVFDRGDCDVLCGVSKSRAIDMLIRSMTPDHIVLDEITSEEDCEAIIRGCGSGCGFIATAHAGSRDDLEKRPIYKKLLGSGAFTHIALIKNRAGIRNMEITSVGGEKC